MKKLLAFFCCVIVVNTHAQNCLSYYYMQAKKNITMTIYNKKGEENGKMIYTVAEVSGSGSNAAATVNTEMFDKKGKSTVKTTNNIKCENGVMMMDLKMMMPQQQVEQFKNASATASNVYLEYPAAMNAGDQLKDGAFNMDIDNNGLKQSISMNITDRKVESKESVTTPAGTWDCYKISYKAKMNIKTMGIGMPLNFDGTEWFAPGFGVVKTESKNGSTAITAIN